MQRNTALKLENTFKPLTVAHKVAEPKEVMISDKDMAIYRHVKLKLAYQRNQAQGLYDVALRMETKQKHTLRKITNVAIGGVIIAAVVGLIVNRIL